MKKYLFTLLIVFLFGIKIKAQNHTDKTRILFIVDYSGSMQVQWGDDKKFNIAKKVLYNLADSIQKTNKNIEIGIRVFGHQSHRTKNDCLDSKLEVPFSHQAAEKIKEVFEKIVAQGNTPIAYSLLEAAKDFSSDSESLNSIILITDGLENCEGNPCDAVIELKKKRISINPYIIGLDIETTLASDFECIGTFINAKDEATFAKVLETVVKKVSHKTSVEINLLSKENKLISNTPITLYNHFNGKLVYNFMHSLDKKGMPDTIYLDPRGVFDIEIHTFPPLKVKNIELKAGVHNKINIPLLKGYLIFDYDKAYDDKKIDYILRPIKKDNILYSRAIKDKMFIADKYNLTILTNPFKEELVKNIPVERRVHQILKINGKLVIDFKTSIRASLYIYYKNKWKIVKDFNVLNKREEIKLLSGKYKLVIISKDAKHSENTIVRDFIIHENKTVLINQ